MRMTLLLASTLLAAATTQAQNPAITDGPLVITGATLIDGTGRPPRPRTTIIARDGRIAAVVSDGSIDLPKGANVINAAGKYVIPGLADMHVHFGLGTPLPRRKDEADEVLRRYLYYGITTVLNVGAMDGSTESIRALRARRAAGTLQAPYIYGTGGHLTLQGTHPVYTIFPRAMQEAADALAAKTPVDEPVNLYSLGMGLSFVRTEAAARKAVQERAKGGMDAIKITIESGPGSFGDNHPLMPVAMVRAIVDEATQHRLPVFAHVSDVHELEIALEGGTAGALHAIAYRPFPDSAIARRMAAQQFAFVPTLTLFDSWISYTLDPKALDDPFVRATISDEEIRALRDPAFVERIRRMSEGSAGGQGADPKRHLKNVLANVGMLHKQGILVAVGTDTGRGYNVHRELELLVEAGLTPMEALQAATRRAAEMLRAGDAFGTIEAGKRADLLVLNANPLADIRNTRSIEIVVSEGRVVDRQRLQTR